MEDKRITAFLAKLKKESDQSQETFYSGEELITNNVADAKVRSCQINNIEVKGDISMEQFVDRKPQYPGRVKLVKVSGSSDLYDMTPAEGSVTGSYKEGTPLNAETLNQLLAEIEKAKLNSICISDNDNNTGDILTLGTTKNLVVKLPQTIKATLKGTADVANSLASSFGKITIKTRSLTTSYTTVYTASTYSAILLIMSPYSGNAKNTAVFAASYADGKTSINDVNYVNKTGYINKRWSGKNFQISMSNSNANGSYAFTIIEAMHS
jgi:hypothetical protein